MKRVLGVLVALVCATTVATQAGAAPVTPSVNNPGYSWAAAPIKDLVARHGWPSGDATSLGRTATRRELARGLAELMRARGRVPPAGLQRPPDVAANDQDVAAISWVSTIGILGHPRAAFAPTTAVTARTADLAIVQVLGLAPELNALSNLHMQNGTRLVIPPGFAQEVLIADLGLHHDYPTREENLATDPGAPISLAELAGMIDGAIKLPVTTLAWVRNLSSIVLPNLTTNQRTATLAALEEVGMPYVWGGTSPNVQTLFGAATIGGFDCSGLVWWAYKLNPGSAALGLGRDIVGRTADAMAWERPAERVSVADLRAGDLVFFGPKGSKSARGTISHVAISLGNGWIVQSSNGGVSVTRLADWWDSGLAWGRRPTAIGAVSAAIAHVTATPIAASAQMTHTLWVSLLHFIRSHYAPALRRGIWARLTAHPATAYAVLTAQMTRARWVVLLHFIRSHYAPALRRGIWARLTAHPASAYAVLTTRNLA